MQAFYEAIPQTPQAVTWPGGCQNLDLFFVSSADVGKLASCSRIIEYDRGGYASLGVYAVALNARAFCQQYNGRRRYLCTNFRRDGS